MGPDRAELVLTEPSCSNLLAETYLGARVHHYLPKELHRCQSCSARSSLSCLWDTTNTADAALVINSKNTASWTHEGKIKTAETYILPSIASACKQQRILTHMTILQAARLFATKQVDLSIRFELRQITYSPFRYNLVSRVLQFYQQRKLWGFSPTALLFCKL